MSLLPVGFEPTVSVGEGPQTYASDRAAIGIGSIEYLITKNKKVRFNIAGAVQ